MKISDFWRENMDVTKDIRRATKNLQAQIAYSRYEMIYRAELEMAEALEKRGAKP
jgi:hypothetical protein